MRLLAAAFALLIASPSHAALVQFDFYGSREGAGIPPNEFTASITFDTSTATSTFNPLPDDAECISAWRSELSAVLSVTADLNPIIDSAAGAAVARGDNPGGWCLDPVGQQFFASYSIETAIGFINIQLDPRHLLSLSEILMGDPLANLMLSTSAIGLVSFWFESSWWTGHGYFDNFQVYEVPEPATLSLMLAVLASLCLSRKRSHPKVLA